MQMELGLILSKVPVCQLLPHFGYVQFPVLNFLLLLLRYATAQKVCYIYLCVQFFICITIDNIYYFSCKKTWILLNIPSLDVFLRINTCMLHNLPKLNVLGRIWLPI